MEKQLRLFTALRFNSKTINEIAIIQNQLIQIDPKAKFVKPISNFHETLFFIGMVESNNLKLIENSFKEACHIYRKKINKPIEIEFEKLGKFKRSNGDIIWLGTKENKDVEILAQLIPDELEKNNYPVQKSNFKAHITLARKFKGELPEILKLPKKVEIKKASLVWSHRNENNTLIYDNIIEHSLINNLLN